MMKRFSFEKKRSSSFQHYAKQITSRNMACNIKLIAIDFLLLSYPGLPPIPLRILAPPVTAIPRPGPVSRICLLARSHIAIPGKGQGAFGTGRMGSGFVGREWGCGGCPRCAIMELKRRSITSGEL